MAPDISDQRVSGDPEPGVDLVNEATCLDCRIRLDNRADLFEID
jgi:hypothetical protein